MLSSRLSGFFFLIFSSFETTQHEKMCREERYLRLGEAVIVFYEINHALCGVEQYSVGGLERGLKG